MTDHAVDHSQAVTLAKPRALEHDVRLNALRWQQDQLGALSITVKTFGVQWERSDETINTWATIPIKGKPEVIEVDINYYLKPGTQMFHMVERKVRAVKGRIPTLKVPVQWNGSTPSTRSKHKDNVDFVMHNQDGGFVMVEVGVVTRKGRFLLTLQEVYAGQFAHTNVAHAKKAGLSYVPLTGENQVGVVLPLWDHNDYPGNDFIRTWGVEAPSLLQALHADGRTMALSKVDGAKWKPPALGKPRVEGRTRGVCTFFNVAAGYGFIWTPSEGEDKPARTHFVHFSDIEGGSFALEPMKVYEFDAVMEGEKSKAKSVRRA